MKLHIYQITPIISKAQPWSTHHTHNRKVVRWGEWRRYSAASTTIFHMPYVMWGYASASTTMRFHTPYLMWGHVVVSITMIFHMPYSMWGHAAVRTSIKFHMLYVIWGHETASTIIIFYLPYLNISYPKFNVRACSSKYYYGIPYAKCNEGVQQQVPLSSCHMPYSRWWHAAVSTTMILHMPYLMWGHVGVSLDLLRCLAIYHNASM